jgi:mannose-6-phosphate isomerase
MAPWLLRLAQLHPEDPGVLASLLLNLVTLAPFEAIYLPAGNLHAYLHGVGLEIMASSDNVLRGGLTPKHVDVAELSRILRFSPFAPEVLCPEEEPGRPVGRARVRRYRTPASEFELSIVESQNEVFEAEGPEIWLLLEGQIQVRDSAGRATVYSQGSQIFLPASERVEVSGTGRFARAGIPPAAP